MGAHARLGLLSLFGALPTAVASGDVLVVDASGGGDYTEIQAAVDQAMDGDLVLIRPGQYGSVQVLQKALHLAADAGAHVRVGEVTIGGIPAGKVARLTGLEAWTHQIDPTLRVSGNPGSVWIEDCEVLQDDHHGATGVVESSGSIVIARCSFLSSNYSGNATGAGLRVVGSNVAIYDSEFHGTVGGGAGCHVTDSVVYLAGSQLTGGNGSWSCSCSYPSSGGAGLELRGHSAAYSLGCTLVGGAGGESYQGFGCSSLCYQTPDGPPVYSDPGSTFEEFEGPVRGMTVASVTREGEDLELHLRGAPGDMVYLPRSERVVSILRPDLFGVQHVLSPSAGLGPPFGPLPADGELGLSLPVGLLPVGESAKAVALQMVVVDSLQRLVLGAPGTLEIVSADITSACDVMVYVDADAPPGGDGESWGTAVQDLQQGLALARLLGMDCPGGGVEVWVAEGTYHPAPPGGDRTVPFIVDSPLAMRGGFAGNETFASQADPALHPTVLSGDLNDDDGPGFANYGENSSRVLAIVGSFPGEGPEVLVEGFTIRGGNADGTGTFVFAGVAGYRNMRIRDCIIERNRSDDYGGGIGVGGDSGPTTEQWVERCTIRDNYTEGFGGGAVGTYNSRFINCSFEANEAQSLGGGLYQWLQGHPEHEPAVVNCYVAGNRADQGAGIYAKLDGLPQFITNCTVVENHAAREGGGLYIESGALPIENSILWGNTGGPSGGMDAQIATTPGVTAIVDYCCVQGWTGALGGEGNTGSDPRLAPDGRLLAGSPCADAGSNAAVRTDESDLDSDGDAAEPWPVDLAGLRRFIDDPGAADVGLGEAPIVDMGAFERQP